ncbi:MAG TPA: hypothetical protein QGF35_03810 [Dehalococcoidia bacterium]|nr:hypothetical protein [Dehalococcoidia bacterium]
MNNYFKKIRDSEEGHVSAAVGGVVGAIGTVLLGIGAAADTGWLAVVGGIVAAVGLLAGHLYGHLEIDYTTWRRIDDLEQK